MNELGNLLKSGWQNSATGIPSPPPTRQLIEEANRLQQESFKFQRSTLLTLSSTFLMMCYFLLFYFGFRDPLSHLGVGLMLGFFLARILLEAYSLAQGRKKNSFPSQPYPIWKTRRTSCNSDFGYMVRALI